MRKLIAFTALCALCLGALCACGGQAMTSASTSGATSQDSSVDEKIQVVCATFPAYDWVMQVIGDDADAYEVTYLMGSGVDLHSFQPSVQDIAKISEADLFVYVGGESDGWAAEAVEAAGNPDLRTVNMMKVLADVVVEEEVVEGMQAEAEDHDHESEAADHNHESEAADSGHDAEAEEHSHEGHHHDGEEPEFDEHVWLSLRHAQTLVNAIADELSAIDADNADVYAANAQAYNEKLAMLDARYTEAVKSAAKDTVVFADRFPFRYLVDDYGLDYFAAFVGCSAETEASFETVAFLAQKIDELGLSNVLVIENSDQKIAQTVIQNTAGKNQGILVMDSLQSATDADVATGKSYLGVMEENLDVLKTALA